MSVLTWDELYPEGMLAYYDGWDADLFASEVAMMFGVDVLAPIPELGWSREMGWDADVDGEEPMRAFWIPAGLVQTIKGSDCWMVSN